MGSTRNADAADSNRPIPSTQHPAPSTQHPRRRFALGGLVGGLAGLGLTGGALVHEARYVNPYRPVLERVELALPPDHDGLAGLRIAFVTDTHVGPFFSPDDVARATALLTPERPDLLLLGGDHISESPRYAAPTAEVLGELVAATPLGGYAVLGNHDVFEGRDPAITAALNRVGIAVLRNAATEVVTDHGSLWIAGLDEAVQARADPRATFRAIPAGAAALALWHEPEWAEHSSAFGAFAQLSGHTHGGQVRLPGIGPLSLPSGGRRHVIGLTHAAGMPIYTSRGVGVYRPPVRLNCPPEVTLITLIPSAN